VKLQTPIWSKTDRCLKVWSVLRLKYDFLKKCVRNFKKKIDFELKIDFFYILKKKLNF
jgi:hypothetical protein